jgi:hypothetical protein
MANENLSVSPIQPVHLLLLEPLLMGLQKIPAFESWVVSAIELGCWSVIGEQWVTSKTPLAIASSFSR